MKEFTIETVYSAISTAWVVAHDAKENARKTGRDATETHLDRWNTVSNMLDGMWAMVNWSDMSKDNKAKLLKEINDLRSIAFYLTYHG